MRSLNQVLVIKRWQHGYESRHSVLGIRNKANPAEGVNRINDTAIHGAMRKRELEMILQSVKPFEEPDASLEQYMTPAIIAADMLFEAYRKGDIADLKVMDLGCGTGMLSIGSWFLDAGMVVGFDASEKALETARSNAAALGADIDLRLSDIRGVEEGADTVVMNPPFGCQRSHADRPFLEKALTLSDCIYSIHMAETLDFVESFCERHGKSIFWRRTYKYEIPHLFSFHSKTKQTVEVAAVGIR